MAYSADNSLRGLSDATWCETRRRSAADHSIGAAAALCGAPDPAYASIHRQPPLRDDTKTLEKYDSSQACIATFNRLRPWTPTHHDVAAKHAAGTRPTTPAAREAVDESTRSGFALRWAS